MEELESPPKEAHEHQHEKGPPSTALMPYGSGNGSSERNGMTESTRFRVEVLVLGPRSPPSLSKTPTCSRADGELELGSSGFP